MRSFALLSTVALASLLSLGAQAGEPGLLVTFKAMEAGDTDVEVRPGALLFVPSGMPPTPFVAPGSFSAEWQGWVSVDLRAEFKFQFELNGRASLEINGKTVKEADSSYPAKASEPTDTVRLSKGTNAIRIRYASPAAGDAFMRLAWFNKETPPGPVPMASLSHTPSAELIAASKLREGRGLFLEYRCARCHAMEGQTLVPELEMDAPSFDGIGSRRRREWMADWILDPKSSRSGARMPKVLRGEMAKSEARAAAAFLSTLRGETVRTAEKPDAEAVEAGQKLFETLHCVACHTAPDQDTAEAGKIGLARLARKFAEGALSDFLKKPEAHYASIRMPNFQLSDEEAGLLSAFLLSKAGLGKLSGDMPSVDVVERGRKVVESQGCLNCHASPLEKQFKDKTRIAKDRWSEGCLSAKGTGAAPDFGFTDRERSALREFGGNPKGSLTRRSSVEFAQRQSSLLQCRECHGKVEGIPAFEWLGGKLKPEYMASFLSGQIHAKPRPWLEARMPAFPSRAREMASGLAELHGMASKTPEEAPVREEMTRAGAKLVSAAGGFSCISCHGVGSMAATQVFEAPGINLALSGIRLQPSYFHRWLRNPLWMDPSTKMPVYFDEEGKSPLADVFGGDGEKQREAIWQYLRLGDKMPPPPSP